MEIAEAYEELNQFCTEKLKGIDYHMILVISKPTPAGPPDSHGFTLSNVYGGTPFAVVRDVVRNVIAQMNVLLAWYEATPAEPLFKKPEADKK